MDDDEKPQSKVQWIKEADGARRRIVTRASAEDAEKALLDPENVPTRTVDTSFDTNIPPDWQGPQNAVFPGDSVYVLKDRKEEMVFDDANLHRLTPLTAEEVIWRLYKMKCWEIGAKDRAAFDSDLWPFHVAAAFIAAQSNEGTLNNIAAHRKWQGRTIRDGRRPDQVMSFKEAVEALRLGLEAGRITARRSRAPGAEVVPAEIFSDPDWELSAHRELLEFEKLRAEGKVLYRRPVLVRGEVLSFVWTVDGPVSQIHFNIPQDPISKSNSGRKKKVNLYEDRFYELLAEDPERLDTINWIKTLRKDIDPLVPEIERPLDTTLKSAISRWKKKYRSGKNK